MSGRREELSRQDIENLVDFVLSAACDGRAAVAAGSERDGCGWSSWQAVPPEKPVG